MSDSFRVGEFVELCNLPPDLARFNGREVMIVELAVQRVWKEHGQLIEGVAYIVSYDDKPRVACKPQYLRKRHRPIDTVDSTEPNKVGSWNDSPWWPEKLMRTL